MESHALVYMPTYSKCAQLVQNHPYLTVASLLLGILLVWRLVKFVIIPQLYPNDPKELPYWVPGTLALHSGIIKGPLAKANNWVISSGSWICLL